MSKDGEYTILKRKYLERGKRIAELEATIKRVEEITYEMGEDTRLGSAAIGKGVMVVGRYLEQIEEAMAGDKV